MLTVRPSVGQFPEGGHGPRPVGGGGPRAGCHPARGIGRPPTVTVNPGLGPICYELTVSGIAPASAAHIHEAPAGQAGPVAVGLAPPTDGASSGCADVERELVLDILMNPSDYYVNVHNTEYPAGAVRGQLAK